MGMKYVNLVYLSNCVYIVNLISHIRCIKIHLLILLW